MSARGKKVALAVVIAIFKGIFGVIRFTLFVTLLLVGRVLEPIASLVSALGLLVFLFCLIFRRDLVSLMWGAAAFAFGGTAVIVLYQGALSLVAPEGTVIISDL